MWESLLSTFNTVGSITYPEQAIRDLDQYEMEIGRHLPKSYRDYCLTFGPGEIVSPFTYRIAAPRLGLAGDSAAESRILQEFCLEATVECRHYLRSEEEKMVLNNALFFATDISYHCYFWNFAEVTSAENHEYSVYVIKRGCEMHRLCSTFADFILQICLVTGIPGDSSSTQRERIFRPRNF